MSITRRAKHVWNRRYGRARPVTSVAAVGMLARKCLDVLLTLEILIYRLSIVPLIAFLPAAFAYGVACLYGEWRYRIDTPMRRAIICNLKDVLGTQLSSMDQAHVARDIFRRQACEAVDVMRLAGSGRALRRMTEIRGLEYLETALAAGHGVVLCSAHFGQFSGAFSLIGSCGFPVTAVGNWRSTDDPRMSKVHQILWWFIYERLLLRHRRRPNIEPGRAGTFAAIQILEILRSNEIIAIPIDAPLLEPADCKRAIEVDFLDRQALMIPGCTSIARITGSPILVAVIYRAPDWRHQVLEISSPFAVGGDTRAAFKYCLQQVEMPIRQNVAYWHHWSSRQHLINLGLIPGIPMETIGHGRGRYDGAAKAKL